ncbi:MAG: hypothetical protein IT304_04090 [Dehalococcoidia bacterium]|nr:hypothetical protein [Dehalococcoidia bacterium]
MRPSSTQIVAGIKWSFDTYVVPDLTSRLGQSAGRSIALLLEHLQARLTSEGQLLSEDNEDMRGLFHALREQLAAVPEAARSPQLTAVLGELGEKAGRQYRPAGAYPTVDSLTEENEDLKRTVVRVIQVLAESRSLFPPDVFEKADSAVRAQVRRQLDRENQWIAPLAGKRPY